ncbi:SixA phosphatase family protein [Janibacter sp. G56]|uniref:SixA phosphatase family protein n=1 Tax=Janibacter sp. G56 TaxID=3418717 RepID=UPI003CFE93DB
MTQAAEERTLVLLRHAEAADGLTRADIDRPLTDRGRRQATAVGQWLHAQGLGCDLVICSTAVRARQTCEEVASAGEAEAEVLHDPRVYNATPEGLLDALREADESADVVMIVGHSPGLPALASLLADGEGPSAAHDALTCGFPTASVAILRYSGHWSSISYADAVLTECTTPFSPADVDAGVADEFLTSRRS